MSSPSVVDAKRALETALRALEEPGAGHLGSLECRVADLQDSFLATRARDLGDVEARLVTIREVVAGLGDAGYLLNLVDAALADVQALAARKTETEG